MMMCSARNDKQLPLGCAKSRDPFLLVVSFFFNSPAVALLCAFYRLLFCFLFLFFFFFAFCVAQFVYASLPYRLLAWWMMAEHLIYPSYITAPHRATVHAIHVHNSLLFSFLRIDFQIRRLVLFFLSLSPSLSIPCCLSRSKRSFVIDGREPSNLIIIS